VVESVEQGRDKVQGSEPDFGFLEKSGRQTAVSKKESRCESLHLLISVFTSDCPEGFECARWIDPASSNCGD
jgi:hypothetical protein